MKKSTLEVLLYVFYCFAISYIFIPLSITDDQSLYIRAYKEVHGKNFLESIINSGLILGSKEPVYPAIIWLASPFISKELLMLIANMTFGYLLIKILQRYNVDKLNIFLFFTGFYFYTLMFSLERLKFSLIFILLSFFFIEKFFFRRLFSILALTTHLQTILLVITEFLNVSLEKKKILNFLLIAFLFLIFVCITLNYFDLYSYIFQKTQIYFSSLSLQVAISETAKCIIFLLIGNMCIKKKNLLNFNIILLILFPFAILLQSGRIIIIIYMVVASFVILERQTNNNFFKILNIYYFVKGIIFLKNIYLYGNGYGNL